MAVFKLIVIFGIFLGLHGAFAIPGVDDLIEIILNRCGGIKSIFNLNIDQLIGTSNAPNVSQMQVYFYHGNETEIYDIDTAASNIMASSYFDKTKPIMVYTHGFLCFTMEVQSVVQMTTSFLANGGYNVMALDTKSLTLWRYLLATSNIEFVGRALGNLTVDFYNAGIPTENFHLVGHSLGAHISGFAGKQFTARTGKSLGRISGLDPAGPCFFGEPSSNTIYKTDASFVDIIHTNAGQMGDDRILGHVDFFPNGGSEQPNTHVPFMDNHDRAFELFASSLYTDAIFNATMCSDKNHFLAATCTQNTQNMMGFLAKPTNNSGAYYLKTQGTYPWGLGTAGINFAADMFATAQIRMENFFSGLASRLG